MGLIQEEDVTIANIYTSNTGAAENKKQMLTAIKREINSNPVIVGYF